MSKAEGIDFWIVRKGEDPYKVAPEVANIISEDISKHPNDRKCMFCGDGCELAAIAAIRVRIYSEQKLVTNVATAGLCVDCAKHGDEKLAWLTQEPAFQDRVWRMAGMDRRGRRRLAKKLKHQKQLTREKPMTKQIDFWVVRKGENPHEVAPEAADEIKRSPRNNVCLFCGFDHETGAMVAFRWREDPETHIYAAEICVDCAKHSNEKLAELTQQEAGHIWSTEMPRAIQEGIDDGSIVPTGETRWNPRTGELQSGYVSKKLADKKSKH
jgi:predicted Fe-S protein YdhL (DUF1289 family)